MATASSSGPRIVVGVSYSGSGTAPLRWAIDQARLMGAAVEAVRAFTVPPVTRWSRTHHTAGESIRGQIAETERAGLEARISQLGSEVQITPVAKEGRPVDVLTQAAWGAELLVLGSPGMGIIRGFAAGATGYALLVRAPCPLILVPAPPSPRLPARVRPAPQTRVTRWCRWMPPRGRRAPVRG